MEVVSSVNACLDNWSNGGESECRSILISPHCNMQDAQCADALASAYEVLVHGLLKMWNPSGAKLSAAELVSFIQSVLDSLPSTSSAPDARSTDIILLGELLVDLIWAADMQLSELLPDAKQLPNSGGGKTDSGDKKAEPSSAQVQAEKLKSVVESDRAILAVLTKRLLNKNIVSRDVCRDHLDTPLLTLVGLLRDRLVFDRKEVRTRTGIFYKQNKFNLIREQSEGYTKLTTDLLASLGPPHSPLNALSTESPDSLRTRAASAWERVMSLIGYFELDPNRAMDIILDIFSVNVTTHWQFFLALLACTPWAEDCDGAFDWESTSDMTVAPEPDQYRGKSLEEILRIAEKQSKSGPVAPAKRGTDGKLKALAQALGFKFTHYELPETQEECPRSLYLTAALLIREGFINVEDLYPHLSPAEEDMAKLHQKYLEDVQNRIKSSSNNLLAMAAPLESQTSNAKPKAQAAEIQPAVEAKAQPPPQKVMIVSALLAVGALRPAISLLTRYPWLVDVHRELADLLLRVLAASISPLYDKTYGNKGNTSYTKPRARYGTVGILTTPMRKPQLTLIAPPPPSTHTHDFVFFYPLWSRRVPVCQSFADVMDVVAPLMSYIQIYMGRDCHLLTKLLRIGKAHVAQTTASDAIDGKEVSSPPPPIVEPFDKVQDFWLQIVRRHILPTLSMMPGNAVCTVEVWNILRQYDATIRWRLYGEWRDSSYKSHPELNAQRVLREREAKGILRRLSSQTVDSLAGTIAKMTHTNPCIFFTNAVHQIQAYDNLADVVIEALQFSTNMGFEILVFTVLDALSNPNKDRLKDDGANASDWLQSLAAFVGAFFRRYNTDPSPILRYIVHQLYSGQTSEIIVLEKLILRMAGIEPLPSLSDSQIAAMAGGPTLRIEAIGSGIRGAGLDTQEHGYTGPQRLGRTLIKTNLAFPILIQVAQQRQACVFQAKDAHLKSIAYLFDATHGVLMQYLDLLTSPLALSLNDYSKIMPPLSDLVNAFGVVTPIAMLFVRPLLNEAITKHADEWYRAQKRALQKAREAKERSLRAELEAKREPSTQLTGTVQKGNTEGPIQDNSSPQNPLVKMEVDASQTPERSDDAAPQTGSSEPENPWIPELFTLFEDCKKIAPGNAYDMIGPGFYLTFWQLSIYDLYFPSDKYAETDKALHRAIEELNIKLRQAERSSDKATRLSRVASIGKQLERYKQTIANMRTEKAAQETMYRFTTSKGGRLDKEKAHWFSHIPVGKSASFMQSFIEYCIQPRCLLSPMDAVYCSRLVRMMHERGTPGFYTLSCYDKLLGDHVKVVIFSCSEGEARNYGRFLRGILSDLFKWHKDQKLYEASNRRKEGQTVTLLPGLQTQWSKDGPSSPDSLLKWTDFKSFLKKCHRKLGKCFTDCIHAGNFMHVYNAVLVLKEIIEVFPLAAVNEVVGSSIDLEIQKLVQTEERGDLKILARAYSSSLKKRENLWAMPKVAQSVKSVASKQATPAAPNAADKPAQTNGTSTPLGPRATQQPSQDTSILERPSSRLALESIPRPEVVKRNRPDAKPTEMTPAEALSAKQASQEDMMQVDHRGATENQDRVAPQSSTQAGTEAATPNGLQRHMPRPSGPPATDLRKEILHAVNGHSRPSTPLLQPPTSTESLPSSPALPNQDLAPVMAPPVAPSQTLQAQELRSSRSNGRVDKAGTSPREHQRDAIGSPLRRSPSPATRPGTRNASADSRTSSSSKRDRSARRDRASPESEERRRTNAESTSRAERSSAHREVPQGRSERNARERIPGSSTRDADREREVDQDRRRERDREKRDRSDRESRREHREKDRDKADRDKERDRHRRDRDEKDRERKSSASKETETLTDHGAPARSESTRHRTHSAHTDENLGKRRRPPDDEPERSAKRGSRREGHREERRRQDSGREQDRDSDHRRKERDVPEVETIIKGAAAEKLPERPRRIESPPPPSPRMSGPVPSGPRAMTIPSPRTGSRGDTSPAISFAREREPERSDRTSRAERLDRSERYDRADKHDRGERGDRDRGDRSERGDREWRTNVEAAPVPHENSARGGPNGSLPSPLPASSSLRDRIGGGPGGSPLASSHSRQSFSGRDDFGDGRKRTVAERDRDTVLDAPLSGTNNTHFANGPKRQRVQINRNRYQGEGNAGALARKALNNLPK